MNYRVYYNKAIDWPQCWSVDEGNQDSEINVQGIYLVGVELISSVVKTSDGNSPSAWFTIKDAVLTIKDGWAKFTKE